jgi:hypothetical protein
MYPNATAPASTSTTGVTHFHHGCRVNRVDALGGRGVSTITGEEGTGVAR